MESNLIKWSGSCFGHASLGSQFSMDPLKKCYKTIHTNAHSLSYLSIISQDDDIYRAYCGWIRTQWSPQAGKFLTPTQNAFLGQNGSVSVHFQAPPWEVYNQFGISGPKI